MEINPERAMNVAEKSDLNLWHGRLGHMLQAGLDRPMMVGYILKLQAKTDFFEHCRYGKPVGSGGVRNHPALCPASTGPICRYTHLLPKRPELVCRKTLGHSICDIIGCGYLL